MLPTGGSHEQPHASLVFFELVLMTHSLWSRCPATYAYIWNILNSAMELTSGYHLPRKVNMIISGSPWHEDSGTNTSTHTPREHRKEQTFRSLSEIENTTSRKYVATISITCKFLDASHSICSVSCSKFPRVCNSISSHLSIVVAREPMPFRLVIKCVSCTYLYSLVSMHKDSHILYRWTRCGDAPATYFQLCPPKPSVICDSYDIALQQTLAVPISARLMWSIR